MSISRVLEPQVDRQKIKSWLASREDCVEAYYQAGEYVGTTDPSLLALELRAFISGTTFCPPGPIGTIDGNCQDLSGTTKKLPVVKDSSEPPLIPLNDGNEIPKEDLLSPGQDSSLAIAS